MSSPRKVIDLRSKKAGALPAAIPSRPSRASPVRARRRRSRLVALAAALALVALAAYGLHVASYAPAYSIGTVSVEGARALSPALVRAYVETRLDDGSLPFVSPRGIFFYDGKSLARSVVDFFPRIESLRLSRPSFLSTTLVVTVRERSPYALWCDEVGRCYTLDETGFIFAGASTSTPRATQYVFEGGIATSSGPIGQHVVKAHFAGIVALLKLFGQAGFPPRAARVENDSDVSIATEKGFWARASFGQDAPYLVRNLALVLSSDALAGKAANLDYVDLRFGDRVYYKLKNGGVTMASSTRQ